MTKEEALREENALCDLEKKHSFSLGRTVTDRTRVAQLSKRREPKKSGKSETSAGTFIIGSGALGQVSGVYFGSGVPSGMIVAGYNSLLPLVPNFEAGKTEERGLAG